MSVNVTTIADAVARANAAMAGLEQHLNAADARLGDGDTGGMLARVIGAMAATDLSAAAEPGQALSLLARAAAAATGSSLGTLLATGLLAAGREARGQATIATADLSRLVAAARDAMMARGGAALGDKTVLDSLDAIATAIADAGSLEQAGQKATEATANALDIFRNRPNRVGRARMFADQTIGEDDPGMIAVAELTKAISHAK